MNIEGFFQILPGLCKSDKPNNITAIYINPLKSDCMDGRIVNGVKNLLFTVFVSKKPPGYKIVQKQKVKLFKKVNKSVLSHITFYIEDYNNKPVDFNGVTVSLTCQLNELKSFKGT